MKIYADDTTFFENRDNGQEFTGIGCLILDSDNTSEIVTDALQALSTDPDINKQENKKQDLRTLTNGYFHACDDSPNAHSHLCTAINNKLNANFQYSYTKNDYDKKDLAWEQCLQYLAVLIPQSKGPIDFYIEQRSSVSEKKIKDVLKYVDSMIDMGNYELYAIPKLYPKINVHIVDKRNAGVQIVDFITWAKNRSHFLVPDKKWEGRLKFTSKSMAGKLGDNIFQGDIVFKKGVRESLIGLYPQEAFPIEEFSGNDEIVSLYQDVIETVIDFLYHNTVLKHQHLHIWDEFRQLREDIISYKGIFNSPVVEGISTCYLRLFDMKPVYANVNSSDISAFKKLLKSKRLCGLTLRKDLIHGTMTRQYLANVFRNSIQLK